MENQVFWRGPLSTVKSSNSSCGKGGNGCNGRIINPSVLLIIFVLVLVGFLEGFQVDFQVGFHDIQGLHGFQGLHVDFQCFPVDFQVFIFAIFDAQTVQWYVGLVDTFLDSKTCFHPGRMDWIKSGGRKILKIGDKE